MNHTNIEEFRSHFRKIVYASSQMKTNAEYLRKLHAYDKHGSHSKAIGKALDRRKELRDNLEKLLWGFSYENWLETSKRLSQYQVSLKRSEEAVRRYKEKIDDLLHKF